MAPFLIHFPAITLLVKHCSDSPLLPFNSLIAHLANELQRSFPGNPCISSPKPSIKNGFRFQEFYDKWRKIHETANWGVHILSLLCQQKMAVHSNLRFSEIFFWQKFGRITISTQGTLQRKEVGVKSSRFSPIWIIKFYSIAPKWIRLPN